MMDLGTKSSVAPLLIILAFVALFTMFEVFGKSEKRFNVERLKTIHRINGIFFILIYLIISYYCIRFIEASKAELSPRGALHAVISVAVFVIYFLKVIIVRFYKQLMNKVPILGITLFCLTFGLVVTSSGYYFLVSDREMEKAMRLEEKGMGEKLEMEGITRLSRAAERGREVFQKRCSFCHATDSKAYGMGPGLKEILKGDELPSSKRPANRENITRQIREPFRSMPPFPDLTDEDVQSIIDYLQTL
ncbi:MAG: cytochrome c [Syntrophobacterales bacterium]|nr:MAG: cytochrome c [Syntrophobacterales bacterium]